MIHGQVFPSFISMLADMYSWLMIGKGYRSGLSEVLKWQYSAEVLLSFTSHVMNGRNRMGAHKQVGL